MNKTTTVYKSIKLNIDAVADLIEMRCGDFLNPAPEGLYYEGQLDPVMMRGEHYIWVDKDDNVYPIEHVDRLPVGAVGIYRNSVNPANIVAWQCMLKSPMRMWSATPTLPYKGMYSVLACAGEYIHDLTGHGKGDGYVDIWDTLLNIEQIEAIAMQNNVLGLNVQKLQQWKHSGVINAGEYVGERVISQIRRHTRPIYNQIMEFIGPHVHNVYSACLKGGELYIEQREDWRALEWERYQMQLALAQQE